MIGRGPLSWEPPIGIEPMTYALRGARSQAAHALAAPMARAIALMALVALGSSSDPVHEPVHAEALCPHLLLLWVISLRSGTNSHPPRDGGL